jgi:hypothetical protein
MRYGGRALSICIVRTAISRIEEFELKLERITVDGHRTSKRTENRRFPIGGYRVFVAMPVPAAINDKLPLKANVR